MTATANQYPITHANPNVPGEVIQYDENVFIWFTTAKAMRVTTSLKKAWAFRASHLRSRGYL